MQRERSLWHGKLPDMSDKTVEKVKQKKFVDFNKLITLTKTQVQTEYQFIKKQSEEGMRFKASSKTATVETFQQWQEAWNVYMQACLHFRTYSIEQLFKYQADMAKKFRRYKTQAVIEYDEAYRQRLANNQGKFGMQDEQAKADHLDGQTLSKCYECKAVDHLSYECPKRKDQNKASSRFLDSSDSRRGGSRAFQSTSSRTYPANANSNPQTVGGQTYNAQNYNRGEHCFYYNSANQRCTYKNCSKIHRCIQCNGTHPSFKCTAYNVKTEFKPSQ